MKKAIHYRELAEEMRYRSCLTADPETREQLRIAAQDFDQIAQAVEDDDDGAGERSIRF
jgi:hypothetical protein